MGTFDGQRRVDLDKQMIRMIEAAITGERLARALDLSSLLYNAKSLQAAIQLSTHRKKPVLAERMNVLLRVTYSLRSLLINSLIHCSYN
jgi:hypothetical protein